MNYNDIIPVNEVYPCIQGEGRLIGVPHLLIRTTGCRLKCQFSGGSFCDTPYSSWNPEKGKFSLNNIVDIYKEFPNIRHTMITGGAPTLHSKLLQELCTIGKEFGHYITIETEGSEYVYTKADLISLSPKLSNSIPIPGSKMGQQTVTDNDRRQHVKWYRNIEAMKDLIKHHHDYQIKPVISQQSDLNEVEELLKELDVAKCKVYLMPEGLTKDQLESRRKWLIQLCIDRGYNFTDRLHIIAYGDKRGV
jgi:7-carboxy-7-deazaguanine synthase